jgi:hypothetical protein
LAQAAQLLASPHPPPGRPPRPGAVFQLADLRAILAAPRLDDEGRAESWTRLGILQHPEVLDVASDDLIGLFQRLLDAGELIQTSPGVFVHAWTRVLAGVRAERPQLACVFATALLVDFSPPSIRLGFPLRSPLFDIAGETSAAALVSLVCRRELGWHPVLFFEHYALRAQPPEAPRS